MKLVLNIVLLVLCAEMEVRADGNLLKRVRQQADVVGTAYGETWNTFYGNGHYKNLMTASLDTRPDGTPNIVLDEAAGKMEVTIRLSVNEANYNAWKDAAHKRFKDANMSYSSSDFEGTEGRMIGGKKYRFSENEEAAIKRWEQKKGGDEAYNRAAMNLIVNVELLDEAGKAVRRKEIRLCDFSRECNSTFPIPLYKLNRLRELPESKVSAKDVHAEDAYAKVVFSELSADEMNTFENVKCVIHESYSTGDKYTSDVLEYVFNADSESWIVSKCVCADPKIVVIPEKIKWWKVVSIGENVFSNCKSLTSVTIPDGVTSIGFCAFGHCPNLTSVNIPDGIRSIAGFAFTKCYSLKSVTIPSTVTNLGMCAFYCCSGLTSVKIPSSVKSISDSAFYGCKGLTEVTMEEGVISICDEAFRGCEALQCVRIPYGVVVIGDSAFSFCDLHQVTIPPTVKKIGKHAFGVNSLKEVWVPASLGIDGFSGVFDGTVKIKQRQ